MLLIKIGIVDLPFSSSLTHSESYYGFLNHINPIVGCISDEIDYD
jgi:hypothetical protein